MSKEQFGELESDAQELQQLANRSYFYDMLFVFCGAALGMLFTTAYFVL